MHVVSESDGSVDGSPDAYCDEDVRVPAWFCWTKTVAPYVRTVRAVNGEQEIHFTNVP